MAPGTSRKIFVNLAVQDLGRSVDFFTGLGFSFDPNFTDESATCMIVSDEAFVMLVVADRFKDFTKKEVADPTKQTETMVALSAASREEVDELVDKALAAGGSQAGETQDHGFMYSRGFYDPDGHHWDFVWMDPAALEG